MVSNYYTLRHIALDLDRRLAGAILREAYSQERNQLILTFDPSLPQSTEEPPYSLIVSCEPSANFCFLRRRQTRAKKNTIDLFPLCTGSRVRSITMHPSDRQMFIHLESSSQLLLQFFGSSANVVCADVNGNVIDAFLCRDIEVNKSIGDGSVRPSTAFDSPLEIKTYLHSFPDGNLGRLLKSAFPTFGSLLVREILVRTNLDSIQNVAELSTRRLADLCDAVLQLLRELHLPPDSRIYIEGEHPLEFSIVPLQLFGNHQYHRYDSIHEGIGRFVGTVRKDRAFVDARQALLHRLEREYDRTTRALEKISQDLETMSRADFYEKMGKLLMANLHRVEKGMKSVEIEDVFESSSPIVKISLEANLTPSRNAERYFDKAKKSRRSAEETMERKVSLRRQAEMIRKLRSALEEASTTEALHACTEEYRDQFEKIGIRIDRKSQIKSEPEVPFRVFRVTGGFEVWAGKSSANNDLLTMKYAKPNDLWFHARGAGGSHVILRAGTGKGELSKRAIEEAASVAAYYSKMKNAKSVPVAMTERKYVRKPKGSPIGTVVIERERVLFVEPKLPSPST